jgi:hypothetical protein
MQFSTVGYYKPSAATEQINQNKNDIEPRRFSSNSLMQNKEPRQLSSASTDSGDVTPNESLEELVDSIVDKVLLTITKKMEAPTAESSPGDAPLSIQQSEFEASMMQTLQVDANGMVNEEEMQYAIVRFLLQGESPESAEIFSQVFSGSLNVGLEIEDAVKVALSELVDSGVLAVDKAEIFNGVSFQAAQLDSDTSALFDSRGGPGDNTIAVMDFASAVKKAGEYLESVANGGIEVESRSLQAPSNVAPQSGGQLGAMGAGISSGSGASMGGFLWKPQSESDGRLVVLLPPALTGNVVSAGIYSSLPASESSKIEEGRFSGDTHNGGRAHFRFSNSGGAYPDGAYVVAQLRDGSEVSFQIKDSSSRNS